MFPHVTLASQFNPHGSGAKSAGEPFLLDSPPRRGFPRPRIEKMTDATPTSPVPFPPLGQLLERLGVRLRKAKGQHYLRDRGVCVRIAELADLGEPFGAIEVGAGIGNLTVELGRVAKTVRAVELEERFREWHDYLAGAYGPLRFLYGDFMRTPWDVLTADAPAGMPWAGVGNLPYQLTSEILFRFLEAPIPFGRLVFMIQREVAERICTETGHRKAGALTYKIALQYEAALAFEVPPECFLPPPRVQSAVIVLNLRPVPLYRDEAERAQLHHFADRLFQYRRKTLANAMVMGGLAPDRPAAEVALRSVEIEPVRRPETLRLEELIALVRACAAPETAKP